MHPAALLHHGVPVAVMIPFPPAGAARLPDDVIAELRREAALQQSLAHQQKVRVLGLALESRAGKRPNVGLVMALGLVERPQPTV